MNPLTMVIRKLHSVEGVIDVWHVEESEKKIILELEKNANSNAGLAIGLEISNLGAKLALQRAFVVCINHSASLRHPPKPILTLAAGEDVLGEEVWEKDEIAKLRSDPNAIFLGNGFVLFRDKVNSLRERRARFEYRPQRFPEVEEVDSVCDVISATISPEADVYVKERAKWPRGNPETGTVLIGFNSPDGWKPSE
jgi:hypothetical protein